MNRPFLDPILLSALRAPSGAATGGAGNSGRCALLVFWCLATLITARSSAQQGIPGTPGVATYHSVANLADIARQEALAAPPPPQKAKPVFRLPKNVHLSIPSGALPTNPPVSKLVQRAPLAAAGATIQSPLIASPPTSAGFLALPDDGRKTLPATQGAVGLNHLMVTLNSQVSIQDRTGLSISTVTLDGWWSSLNCSNVSDPHVVFDPYRQRWIFTSVGDRETPLGLLVAVSQTSDPTGNWNQYFYQLNDSMNGVGPLLGDTPSVGFNTNRIVVQVNLFDTNFLFYGSSIFAFNKADLYAGGAGAHRFWTFPDSGSGLSTDYGLSQVPAVTYSSTLTVNYLVKNWDGNYIDPNTGTIYGSLRIFSITGPVGAEVFNTTDNTSTDGPFTFSVNNPWDATSPDDLDFLPQFGSTNRIYAGDARLVNVVYRDSTLWAAQTVFLPSGTNTPTHSAVQWWQITPMGTVFQQGRIEDPSGNVHYAYPSIAVNTNDDVLVGYSRFSANQYPSANYSFRVGEDPLSSLRDDTVLKLGEAAYYSPDQDSSLNLWGDWSATMVDPSNDSDLWTIQEYAASPLGTNSHWGTWWGLVAPPANLTLTMTHSPDPIPVGANLTYTLLVTNANNPSSLVSASGVKVTDALPPSLAFVSASSTKGNCSYSGGVVTCDLGNVPIQSKVIITLVVTATSTGQITNKATVFGNGQELSPADNTAISITTVIPSADLGVVLFDSPDPVALTSNLTYTIIVTNSGPATASAVTLTNTLPASVTFLSANSTQGTNTRSGNVIAFTIGSLASGASVAASIRVSCPTAGAITNRAVVASSTADPVPANNSAIVTTRVNAPPTIQTITNRTINEDATDNISFIVGDAETVAANLVVSVTSSNPALILTSNIVLGGTTGSRTATVTPLGNQFGSSMITLTVTDGDGASAKTSWTETVTSVNDPPTLDFIGSITVTEDSGPYLINLSGITSGAPNEPDPLTVTATSSNPAIIPNAVVSYASPNNTGTLAVTPAPNAFGTVTITVKVNDNQLANNLFTRAFTVTVTPVNDPPTLSAIASLNINEDAPQQTVSLGGITSGASNEPDTLTVSAVSSDTSIIPNPAVSYTTPNVTGTMTFTPLPTKFGSVVITVTVNDNQPSNNIITRTFGIMVNPVNDPPTLNSIANLSLNEDAPQQTINLTGISTGATNEFDSLTVTATSSSPTIIPNPVVNYTTPDNNGSLTFTPVPAKFGSATITVTVNDGQPTNNTVTRTFTVTVNAVNDPPTLDAISDLAVTEDSGPRTVSLTGITSGAPNEPDNLTVTATSSNPSLIPTPAVAYTSPSGIGSLQFTPVTNAFGTAVITVKVNDNQLSNNIVRQSFTVTVAPVNDPPTINGIANISITQDAGMQTVNLSGIGTGATNELDALAVTATSSNPGLIPDPSVNYTSPNPAGSLTFTPVPAQFGNAIITLTVNDGQPSNNIVTRTFTVTVSPVNHPPTVNSIADVTLDEDFGQQSVGLAGITSGGPSEVQTLTVTASNNNHALLTNLIVNYTSPATTATLSFKSVTNANGSALITVTVNDGGASNNIIRQTFKVTVNPINDLPFISDIPDQMTAEDVPITIHFMINDVETAASNLVLAGQSSNEEVISSGDISFGGSGTNRTVTVKPLTHGFGSSFITLTLNDSDGGSSYAFFELVVNFVNYPPTISTIGNRAMNEDDSLTLSFTVNDVETPADLLNLSATSSNQGLVPNANLILGGSGANRTLTLNPITNQAGAATIKLFVTDSDSATTTNSFLLSVNAVNDPPTLDPLGGLAIPQNAGQTTVNLTGISSGAPNEIQTLSVTASNSNPALLTNLLVSYISPATSGALTFRTVTNAIGSATITVMVRDGGASNNFFSQTFIVNVNSTSSPPLSITFAAGQAIVSWPANPPGFLLQRRDSFSTGSLWIGVTDKPMAAVGRWYVTNSAAGSCRFYRLFKSAGTLPTDPIQLNLSRAQGTLTISWTSSSTNALLEASDTLTPGRWQPVNPAPVRTGSQSAVTVDSTAGQKFFRLRIP